MKMCRLFRRHSSRVCHILTSLFKFVSYVDVSLQVCDMLTSIFKCVANVDANFQVRRTCERHSFNES